MMLLLLLHITVSSDVIICFFQHFGDRSLKSGEGNRLITLLWNGSCNARQRYKTNSNMQYASFPPSLTFPFSLQLHHDTITESSLKRRNLLFPVVPA